MKNILKRLAAVSLALMVLLCGAGSAFAEPLVEGNGKAYFYFDGDSFGAGTHFLGFAVNNGAKQRVLSATRGHTEEFDKTLLKPGEANTITVYTGNSTGFVDETKSRNENKDCDEFSVSISNARLILPDGKIVMASSASKYVGKDNTSALNSNPTVTTVKSGGVSLGDNSGTYAYKVEIVFDLTDISYTDISENQPAIKNVSLEIGATPDKRNIVWYSTSENAGKVQLALKSAMTGADFPSDYTEFAATAEVTGYIGYTSYKSTMTGLSENSEYVYRVGDGSTWSNIYSFKTQDFDGDFSFLAVADPQLGQGNRYTDIANEIAGWTTTLNKAKNSFYNDAAFLASMGDQIANAQIDGQYDAFFKPEDLKNFTLSVVPGNHDVGYSYTPHYNMPNVSDKGVKANMGSGSGDYYFTYGDALFIGLNLMADVDEEHIAFMEEIVEAHPNAKWKFVMMHYAIYGSTEQGVTTEKIVAQKELLAPVFSRLGIDVVFQGHEHCYARSYMMNGHTPNTATGGNGVTQPDPSEVLYLTFNSASGSDYVTTITDQNHIAKRVQERRPNFSKIDVTDNAFTVTSYFSDSVAPVAESDVVDTYTITRDTTATVKSVHIADESATMKKGKSLALTAQAYGYNTPSQEMTWSVSGNQSANTKINEDGVLTVDVDEKADSLVVTACAAGDADKYDTINVTLTSAVTSVNVAPKENYNLPATVGEVEVTKWTNAQGETVTVADTSLTGYRYYTAALADGTTEKYRVNVGEYVRKYDDLLAGFSVGCMDNTATAQVQLKEGNGWLVAAKGDAANVQVVQYDAATKALKNGFANTSFIGPKTQFVGEYRLNAKIKLDDVTLPETDQYVARWDLCNYNATILSRILIYVTKDGYIKLSAYNSTDNATAHNGEALTSVKVENRKTPWFDISYRVYDNKTWSIAVNGVDVLVNKGFRSINDTNISLSRFAPHVMTNYQTISMYCTDVTLDTVRYFEDKQLPTDTTAEITQGAIGEQTVAATLTMSDGKTQSFDVKFTADTKKTGVQTVAGRIDGFDDTIPVTVNVKNIITGIVENAASVEKATIQKVGNITSGVAVFALYYGSDKIQSVKIVPFSEADFTDGVATLNIGLTIPSDITDSYVQGFVLKNLTGIIPVDTPFTTKK